MKDDTTLMLIAVIAMTCLCIALVLFQAAT